MSGSAKECVKDRPVTPAASPVTPGGEAPKDGDDLEIDAAGILNNERYIGQVVFGKTKQERDPDTQKLVRRPTKEVDWTVYHDPLLQIVPDELWSAVKARQALISDKVGKTKAGGLARTEASRAYLVSGLLDCGPCGDSMVLNRGKYMCTAARRKMGCSNNVRVDRVSLERQLIGALASTIVSEVSFTEVKNLFMPELAAGLKRRKEGADSAVSQRKALLDEEYQLKKQLKNLVDEVATYGGNEEFRQAMRGKKARLTFIDNTLKRAEVPAARFSQDEIDDFLRKALQTLADILLGDPVTAKQELMKRVSSLTLAPAVYDGTPAVAVSGDMTLFSGEEVMMLLPPGTSNQEHNPVVINLDGLVLKLDCHRVVAAVARANAFEIKTLPTRQTPVSLEDFVKAA